MSNSEQNADTNLYDMLMRHESSRRYLSLGVDNVPTSALEDAYIALSQNQSDIGQFMAGHAAYDLAVRHEAALDYHAMKYFAADASERFSNAANVPRLSGEAKLYAIFAGGIQYLAHNGSIAANAEHANEEILSGLQIVAGNAAEAAGDGHGKNFRHLGVLGESVVGSLLGMHMLDTGAPSVVIKAPLREDRPAVRSDQRRQLGMSRRSDLKIIDVPTRSNKGKRPEAVPVQVTTAARHTKMVAEKTKIADKTVALITRDTLGIEFIKDYLDLGRIIARGREGRSLGGDVVVRIASQGIVAEVQRARHAQAQRLAS